MTVLLNSLYGGLTNFITMAESEEVWLERVILVNTILASPSRLTHYARQHNLSVWQAKDRLMALLNKSD